VGRAGLGQGHEEKLQSVGYAQLVVNAKKVILDGVLTQSQALGNFTIRKSFGKTTHHIHFPFGKQT